MLIQCSARILLGQIGREKLPIVYNFLWKWRSVLMRHYSDLDAKVWK